MPSLPKLRDLRGEIRILMVTKVTKKAPTEPLWEIAGEMNPYTVIGRIWIKGPAGAMPAFRSMLADGMPVR
jgi:hypothetical protein